MAQSLSLKIIGMVLLESFVVFAPLAYLNIERTRINLVTAFVEKATTIARVLDANISSENDLSDKEFLLTNIQKNIRLDPDITFISINTLKDNSVVTYVSSIGTGVDQPAEPANQESYVKDVVLHEILEKSDRRYVKVITPIHTVTDIVGTYQIELTLERVDSQIAAAARELVIGYFVMAIMFASILYWTLRVLVIQPIENVNRGVERIADGNLDFRITPSSSDELGTLASAFNRMGKDLEDSRSALTKLNEELEQRVDRRSRQLSAEIAVRELAEAELAHHQKLESLGNLSGGIAHNLNNLLQPMFALSRMLTRKLPAGSKELEYAEKIAQASERAKDLVTRVVQFSRRELPGRELVDICKLIDEALELTKDTLPTTAELAVTLDKDTGLILADASQIETAFINLLSNAADSLNGRSGQIFISLSGCDLDGDFSEKGSEQSPGPYAKLVVRDNGTGMGAETLERVFEPFFTTKDIGKGTGLGLSSTYGIVQNHHGLITCDSQLGVGSTFEMYLPIFQDRSIP